MQRQLSALPVGVEGLLERLPSQQCSGARPDAGGSCVGAREEVLGGGQQLERRHYSVCIQRASFSALRTRSRGGHGQLDVAARVYGLESVCRGFALPVEARKHFARPVLVVEESQCGERLGPVDAGEQRLHVQRATHPCRCAGAGWLPCTRLRWPGGRGRGRLAWRPPRGNRRSSPGRSRLRCSGRRGLSRSAGGDDGAFAAGDFDDRGLDGEAADGFGEAVVVGEDDDLAVLADAPGGPWRGRRPCAGSMDWTGSSMTTKRNGLSGRVARGMKRLRARECSSPWLITPRAAPSWPSTVTFSSTFRRLAAAAEVDVSSETLLWSLSWSQMLRVLSAIGAKRSLLMASAASFIHFSAAFRFGSDAAAFLRLSRFREPVAQGRGDGAAIGLVGASSAWRGGLLQLVDAG